VEELRKGAHAEGCALAKKRGKVATASPAERSTKAKWLRKAIKLRKVIMAAQGSHSCPTFYFYYSKLSGINMQLFFNRIVPVVCWSWMDFHFCRGLTGFLRRWF
jgi:hypothetical protein